MEPFADRRSRVRALFVVVLAVGLLGGGTVAGIDGVSTANAQPEIPDPDSDIEDAGAQGQDEEQDDAEDDDEASESDVPVNPDGADGAAGEETDAGEGAGADTGAPADPAADGESDTPEPPPEGVSAEEYYDEEQLDEWQEMADDTPTIGDVRELEAQEAHDIFVDTEERDLVETEQVGPGPEDGVPTAGDLLHGGAAWFAEAGAGLIEFVFDNTIEIVIGTPVPENAGWLGIFGEPTNEPFATLFADLHETWLFPLTLSFFSLALLLNASALPFAGFIGKYSASKWMLVAFGTIVAVALSWPVVTLLHLTADTIALSIAPSGADITSSQGIETLVASAGAAAAAFYLTMGFKMVLYGLIFGMRYFFLLMVLPYTFGFTVAIAMFAPWRGLRKAASGALWIHMALLVIPIPMAILFRAAYLIEWGFGFEGLTNLLLIMGLLVATIAIPIWMLFKATTMTGMLAGAVSGAGASLAARDSYKPKSIGYAKNASGKAMSAGRSIRNAPDRARAMSSSAADRATALRNGDLGALRRNFTPSSSSSPSSLSSSSSSGGTQAERKRIATDGGEKRRVGHFRRRNRNGGKSR